MTSLLDVEVGIIAGQSRIAFVRTTGRRLFMCCCKNTSSGGRERRATAVRNARFIRGGRVNCIGLAALVESLVSVSLHWRFEGRSSPSCETVAETKG
jgi:hypothetical protein